MSNLNPTTDYSVAKSIQRDYRQAAENYRLDKEVGWSANGNPVVRIGLAMTILIGTAVMIAQYLI